MGTPHDSTEGGGYGYAEPAKEYKSAIQAMTRGTTHADLQRQRNNLIEQRDRLIQKIDLLGQLIALFEG